ncbi:hypothetical protein Hanom_Chr00s131209g01815421 [Helianthus anomalus]
MTFLDMPLHASTCTLAGHAPPREHMRFLSEMLLRACTYDSCRRCSSACARAPLVGDAPSARTRAPLVGDTRSCANTHSPAGYAPPMRECTPACPRMVSKLHRLARHTYFTPPRAVNKLHRLARHTYFTPRAQLISSTDSRAIHTSHLARS